MAEDRDGQGNPVDRSLVYVARETKNTLDRDKLRPDERRKITRGGHHFSDARGVDYAVVTKPSEILDESFIGRSASDPNDADVGSMDRLRADLGLSDEDLAATLAVSPSDLARWQTADGRPSVTARRRLLELSTLRDRLTETFLPVEKGVAR